MKLEILLRWTQPQRWAACLMAAAVASAPPQGSFAQDEDRGPGRWAPQIAAFEAADRQQAPPKHGVLFVGSSSIRRWKLEDYFPDLPVINRGFGGSQIADSAHFADRIILPHEPRVVVLYAGDNDIARGKSPQQIAHDYLTFVNTVHAALPRTRIVFIAIKPSIRRWELVDKMRQGNALVKAIADKHDRLVFVDIDKPMLGEDGRPRKELFVADGLHLSDAGYRLWASLLQPHLKRKRNIVPLKR